MILVSLASPISTHLSYDAPNPAGHILCSHALRPYSHVRAVTRTPRPGAWEPVLRSHVANSLYLQDKNRIGIENKNRTQGSQNLHSSPHTRFRFRQRHRIRSAISDTVTSTDPELGLYYS
ncbi:hypothetical protein NEOLEDRAFT_987534 [Neolentinus lepideus HHB14362 ss-1]|uniref:Uncharacterized protein n=1 Tax=Neolentinus lepideus HHB14362 ss-1 TaxID=1314782 RepID=A0A165N5N9_9AGAM|nr:hypothetical protein NEOLEDRAFT_987534 [Neolentinus lepideus HHB14362 ss-1]